MIGIQKRISTDTDYEPDKNTRAAAHRIPRQRKDYTPQPHSRKQTRHQVCRHRQRHWRNKHRRRPHTERGSRGTKRRLSRAVTERMHLLHTQNGPRTTDTGPAENAEIRLYRH